MRRAAAKHTRGGPTRSRGASFVTLVGLFLSATGLATIAMIVLTTTTLAQSGPGTSPQDIPRMLGSLKTATVPTPPNLSDFVVDKPTAIALGKAFFWDMQMGSDGTQACATCHFQAGADVRTKNTISPGLLGGDINWQGKGPNYQLTFADYPLHHLIDSDDNQSFVVSDK